MKIKTITVLVVLSLLSVMCNKKKEDNTMLYALGFLSLNQKKLKMNVSVASAGRGGSVSTSANLLGANGKMIPKFATASYNASDFVADSIASGAPDKLVLKVKKLSLYHKEKNIEVPVFNDSAGKDIVI